MYNLINFDAIRQKYGFVNTWEEGQASGTCFARGHRSEIVDRLKRAIDGTNKRRRVFGPVMAAYAGQVQWESEAAFRECRGLRRRGGIGRYLDSGIVYGEGWDSALTDALFDVLLVFHNPSHKEINLHSLRIPTIGTLLEFLKIFVGTDGKYICDVHVSCYWLEDMTLPDIPKVYAWNAFFGALCGKNREEMTIDPNAFNTFPIGFYRGMLSNIWDFVFGSPLPDLPLETICKLFWVHKRSRGPYRYGVPHVFEWYTNSGERLVANEWSGFNDTGNAASRGMRGRWESVSNVILSMPDKTYRINDTVRAVMKQFPDGPHLSQVLAAPIRGRFPTDHMWCAIGVHPLGIDSLVIPWQDPSVYDLQVVTLSHTNAPQRIRVIRDHGPATPGVYRRTRPLYIRDWCFTNSGGKALHDENSAKMRWHLKGSPFVGPLSPWRIRYLREITKNADGYIVQ